MTTPNTKETIYAYVRKPNKKFLEKMSKKNNLPMSKCVDMILDALRCNKGLTLDIGTKILK